jgi:hypothetical protein
MHGRLGPPSPGIAIAALALVLSVGGNAAAAVLISSNAQVAANTIAGHHPPSGRHPNIIGGSVSAADLAALPPWVRVRAVHEPAPSFACFEADCDIIWSNTPSFPDLSRAGFYKWHGEVHLKGNVCTRGAASGACFQGRVDDGDHVIFTLPVGYRPAHTAIFLVASNVVGTEQGTVYIQASTGRVVARNFNADGVSLDGIAFRVDN